MIISAKRARFPVPSWPAPETLSSGISGLGIFLSRFCMILAVLNGESSHPVQTSKTRYVKMGEDRGLQQVSHSLCSPLKHRHQVETQ